MHDFTVTEAPVRAPREPVCYLRLDSGTRMAFYSRPNPWRRFWYWLLLGWTFEPR